MVIREGQADCRVVVNGSAKPEGRFIDDTSKLSEAYAVIQDSYRYQWFSYVISSPIQQIDYETFVREIIHPSGFIQFADLTIHSSVFASTQPGYVRDEEEIKIIENPCAPMKLLAADGTPILAKTEHGDKFILARAVDCERTFDLESCYLGLEINELLRTEYVLEITDDDGVAHLVDIPCISQDDDDDEFLGCAIGVSEIDALSVVINGEDNMLETDCMDIVENDNPLSLNI